jgi:proteasome lid subunit RPN8/RPN11
MTLAIASAQLQQICQHAAVAYPQECCGLIVGKISGETKQTIAVYPMPNTWTEDVTTPSSHSMRDRYAIDPAAMLDVIKQSRSQGLEIIGIYHSHPDHPAIPSECDRQLAWSHYAYLIVSVDRGEPVTQLCWCLDRQQQFQSEVIAIIGAA